MCIHLKELIWLLVLVFLFVLKSRSDGICNPYCIRKGWVNFIMQTLKVNFPNQNNGKPEVHAKEHVK